MTGLAYSTSALNTLPAFHGVRWVVFVEGQDDVVFWSAVFRCAGAEPAEFKPTPFVERYAQAVVDDDAVVVVARDRDHRGACGELTVHPRLLWTEGHSIENHLCRADLVAAALASLARTGVDDVHEVEEWLAHVDEALADALVREVANCISDAGHRVLGTSCQPFMTSKRSASFCPDRLARCVEQADDALSADALDAAREKLDDDERRVYYAVRGHFLVSAVFRFLKHRAERTRGAAVKLSIEHVFTLLLALFEARWAEEREPWLTACVGRLGEGDGEAA